MLATLLRRFIAFELTVYLALALYVLETPVLTAMLFALAGVLGLRLWIVGLTFVFAWRHRSPAPRLGRFQAIGMFLGEFAAFILNFVALSPFERWWMGDDRLPPNGKRPPVLLIHGYGCSRAAWWWQRRGLEQAGWTVATISLEPIYTDIENYVDAVARRVDDVLAATGAPQMIVVGHSMGGLVARAYLRKHGVAKTIRLITLGTPHLGSELARVGIGENARQMTPGNAWLAALASEEPSVDTVNIFSSHDNFVTPTSNLLLPRARQQPIDGLGHLSMLYSPRVALFLREGLEAQETGSRLK
ncbi:alpha/beta fold hydrolase [Propionivibrio sp.]|uniref:lipase family alpha/beta hydrolase n=1 Tax=Propionivibrio sp. TaxID=2212460 RepID=UPI0025FF026F|nr:alpha/beta fold hydrolase [Propionivibrio sp.]MBK7355504.1 alpha/beta fold hydrolase [Propionivibrio sp.]